MKWGEMNPAILPDKALQLQVYDTAKRSNPTTHVCVCRSDDRKPAKSETAGVISGRVGRIWKGLLPQLYFAPSNSISAKR